MRRIIIVPTALLVTVLALAGCSATSTSQAPEGATAPLTQAEGERAAPGADTVTAPADRQVVTTGSMTLTVEKPLTAADDAIRIIEASGGRIDGRTEQAATDDGDTDNATLTLRIPSASLTSTLDKLRDLGTVQDITLNSNDVTMATQDLDARITALTASVDRLVALLATASDTDTLIKLETAISDRQAQLESLQAERRYYADQVSLSTITLTLLSPAAAPPTRPGDFLSGLQLGWNLFVGFLGGLLVVVGALLPWAAFAAVVTFVVILIVQLARRRRNRTTAP